MDKLAQLEKELLADMKENLIEYEEEANNVFEIDSNLRIINIPISVKNIGVESDDDVKRLEFTMPKQYGEFDLSQFRIRINYMNANGDKDIYLVEDKKVSGDKITFSWLVGRDVVKQKGQVNFIVCLKLSDEKGKILKELNTTLCRLEVLEGLEVVPVIDKKTTDIIEQLLRMVETETTGAVRKVTEEGIKQVAVIQKAAQEIAADREQIRLNKTAIDKQKNDHAADIAVLTQSKAPAVIENAKGNPVTLKGSADMPITDLEIVGNTTQNGVPSPSNPVEIVNGKISEINVTGKNFFDVKKVSKGSNTIEELDNGLILSNNATEGYPVSYIDIPYLKSGTYFFSCDFEQKGDVTLIQIDARELGKPGPVYKSQSKTEKSGVFGFLITIPENKTGTRIYLYSNVSGSVRNVALKLTNIQMEAGTTATAYEKYKEQMIKFSKPITLLQYSSILKDNEGAWKKSTGMHKEALRDVVEGRTTFASHNNGTKYVSIIVTKKVLHNGKIYSNTHKSTEYSTENGSIYSPEENIIVINDNRFTDYATFKNIVSTEKAEIEYQLKTPVIEEISADEQAALNKIQTFYPNTVIQTNDGITLELSYFADTKNYIDRKIKEAVNSQIQSTANLLSLMPLSTQASMIENDTNNILEHMEVEK